THPGAFEAGQFPPGPPLILGVFWDLWHHSAAPVGSSQGQQRDNDFDPNRYAFLPSRFSVPSTTVVARPDSLGPGFSPPTSTMAPPGLSFVDKNPSLDSHGGETG